MSGILFSAVGQSRTGMSVESFLEEELARTGAFEGALVPGDVGW